MMGNRNETRRVGEWEVPAQTYLYGQARGWNVILVKDKNVAFNRAAPTSRRPERRVKCKTESM